MRSGDNLRPMLGDQFHLLAAQDLSVRDLCSSDQSQPSSQTQTTDHRATTRSERDDDSSPVTDTGPGYFEPLQVSIDGRGGFEASGRGLRYPTHHHYHHHQYQPLVGKASSFESKEPYDLASTTTYANLANQKRESVITSAISLHKASYHPHQLDVLVDHLVEDEKPLLGLSHAKALVKQFKSSSNSQILIQGLPFTVDQVVCICQVLQKCDLPKLEKFVYSLPGDSKLAKNELVLRARSIAAYHSGNYKEVYEILESNNFSVKYHQELQTLWNNAHYKEHEMKRGHPPGAVEKYRIRKKYQFPRTIWDGEEYVYCFKEKNRRILKEFYLKCNLPTQEDKLKLSNQTQLTVVQISNWFKNRRQRDRQPQHHHHHQQAHHHHHPSSHHDQADKASSDAQSTQTNDSSTPSPSPIGSIQNEYGLSESSVRHHDLGTSGSSTNFCQLLSQPHSGPPTRAYYFLSQ